MKNIKEDVTPGYAPKEITYRGYTTKNLHHSEEAAKAFTNTIDRVNKGLVKDDGSLVKALKATDAYMQLSDKHLQQQRAESPEELAAWVKYHDEAGKALANLGEFLHHQDYWNAHKSELEYLQANASINNPMGELYMSYNPFQDVLDEKKLTPAEMKKREEVAKAIERENPDMPMAKKMAIATATAKKVAEETELSEEVHSPYRKAALALRNKSFESHRSADDRATFAMHADLLKSKDPKDHEASARLAKGHETAIRDEVSNAVHQNSSKANSTKYHKSAGITRLKEETELEEAKEFTFHKHSSQPTNNGKTSIGYTVDNENKKGANVYKHSNGKYYAAGGSSNAVHAGTTFHSSPEEAAAAFHAKKGGKLKEAAELEEGFVVKDETGRKVFVSGAEGEAKRKAEELSKQTGKKHSVEFHRTASAKDRKQVNEVSKPTLKSYVGKAMQDTLSGKKDRNKGMQAAYSRLAGTDKPLMKEDEQLDEISKDLARAYVHKAEMSEPKDERQYNKRSKAIEYAKKKIASKETSVSEEVESLDEISKDLARAYVHKAEMSEPKDERQYEKRSKAIELAKKKIAAKNEEVELDEGAKGLKPGWMLKQDPELARKTKEKVDTAKKRQKAYGNPDAGKSVKEEAEQIDEISKKTAMSYLTKSGKDIEKGTSTGEKRNKRIDGYFAAGKRLSGEKPTSEEVDLDEANFAGAMKKAIDAHERGDHARAKYHLDNAKTARYAMKSTEISKHKDLLDKYKELRDLHEEVDIPKAHQIWQRMNPEEKAAVMSAVGHKGSVSKTHKACMDHIKANMDKYKKHLEESMVVRQQGDRTMVSAEAALRRAKEIAAARKDGSKASMSDIAQAKRELTGNK